MEPSDPHSPAEDSEPPQSPLELPPDLPTSLDDRRNFDTFDRETEYYDGWQGSAQYITAPTTARPLDFDLQLDTPAYDDAESFARMQDSDSRLMEMVAAQAHHREDGSPGGDEDVIATDEKMDDDEKKQVLQKALNMAASNGDVNRIRKLVGGRAKAFVDVNLPDEEGTVPLIYASCFGHVEVVKVLLDAGANVDRQDRNQWSALMWAMTNRHKGISKLLLDHGANPEVKSVSGGTAYDFVQPGSDFSRFLGESGYRFGEAEDGDDFYQSGFDPERLDEEIVAESEMKRRQLMHGAAGDLEVDLGNLGFGEEADSPQEDDEDDEEFIWERCVGDQMFVFQDGQLDPILDLIVTNMTPQRSPSQKPVPANLIFLMARYAHYHMTHALLEEVLNQALDRINDVIERYQWDMTMLAFWISNTTLLLHYLKKDAGLVSSTTKYQAELAELINETFILIIRDAERRMNKTLDVAMLDHETIPGFDEIEFQGEWKPKVFQSKKTKVEELNVRPPPPARRIQTSPRNITSLLSSTLFVLDLYDVHSVIMAQILAQLLYWIGAELFNRVITTRRYLSRTKAMQIRMNVSQIEDWARANNRQPEHYENGALITTGEDTISAARRHLAPVIQLLQWLQCFSSLGEDQESLTNTLIQLQRLTPQQIIHSVKNYRAEVGEKSLPKAHMKFLTQLQKGHESLMIRPVTPAVSATPSTNGNGATTPSSPSFGRPQSQTATQHPAPSIPASPRVDQGPDPGGTTTIDFGPGMDKNKLTLDQSHMLEFSLPQQRDMLISYGTGVDRERGRKYIPTVPTEVLARFNLDEQGPKRVERERRGSVGTVAREWR